MITLVIGNGPSSAAWIDLPRYTPTIGCNFAVKDFSLDHLVCVDRLAVHEVRKLSIPQYTKCWVKTSPLETPPGWSEFDIPGIDSGSAAIKLAGHLYEHTIFAVGFDGVLNNDNSNRYTYPYRNQRTPKNSRDRHRAACVEIHNQLGRVVFVNDTPDPELETMSYVHARQAIESQLRKIS